MKVISAEFVTSAAAAGSATGVPRDGLGQVAMTGRSNVGKSTLINALCRRPLARTSAAAGKTRLANVFRLTLEGGGPGRWEMYLVDLPGYGYARGGADSAKELAAVAEAYFRETGTVTVSRNMVCLLVDSRHPGLEADTRAYRWLTTLCIEPIVVATKIDKLSRAERTRNLRELERVFGTAALPVSAERGEGLEELWTRIARTVRATKDRR
ncbi:MAG: ribosome biogenesis GTP-binding protein YsxC [Acidobacteria bacterium]|nr:ribosome biogenesis GTP-binding protein YsxC [Acidobacteriota bacterium]